MRLDDRSCLRGWLRVVLFPSLSLAVMALAFFAAAAQGQTFSTPVTVARGSTYPQMALDPSGNPNVTWIRVDSDNNPVFFSRSTDGGGTFAGLAQLSGSRGTNQPRVAVDSSGAIDLVWTDAADKNVHFARSTNGGVTFSAATTVSVMPGSYPRVAVDAGGDINVVWQHLSNTSTDNNVWFSHSTDGGANFSAPLMLSNPGEESVSAQIALGPGGNTYVSWTAITGAQCNVWFSHSTGGATFSAPLNLSNSSACAALDSSDMGVDHQIIVDASGDINIAWIDSSSGAVFRRSTDGGAHFSPPTNVSPGFISNPQIAVDSRGVINVVWSATDSGTAIGHSNVFFSRSTDGGSTFSAQLQLNTLTGQHTNPSSQSGSGDAQIAVASSTSMVVLWWDNSFVNAAQGAELFSSVSTDGGAHFSTPVAVSSNAGVGDGQLPQLAIDSAGNAELLWSSDINGNDSLNVYFSRGTVNASSGGDFTISAAPGSLVVLLGGSATTQITATSTGGFNHAVNLSCSKLPSGVACSFDSASVTPANSGAKVNLTLTVPPTLAQGNFTFTITAAGGGTTHTQDVQVAVGGLSGSVAPAAMTIAAGSASNFTVTVNSTGGFTGQVNMACSGAPSGVACNFSPAQFTLQANATAMSTLTVQVSTKPSGSILVKNGPQVLPTTTEILPIASFALLLLSAMAFALSGGTRRNGGAVARALAAIVLAIALAAGMLSCGGATNSSTGTSGGGGTGTSGGTGGTGVSGGSGSTPITFPMSVQAQSGSAIANLDTISITVP
jgi:hypothetical protein